jgi:serine/threonine-protein kinase
MADILDRLRAALADRHRIERELGRGGMATVYLAHDLKHDRQVALKVMRPELSAILGGERFLREVSIAAKLNHPHILALHDSGQAEEYLYYVMPYVEGESLRAKLNREKQLSVDEAISITKQVGAALDYAHEQGVIHRDIKPENILMYQGEALVADFGIALAVTAAGGTRLTDTGLSLGTPEYMSPEQATGERELDARSDMYSLGAITYEMLVGEPPHTGNTLQAIIAKVVSAEPQPVSRVRHSVPSNVDAAVMCALAKTPADRFGSGAAFGDALDDLTFAAASSSAVTSANGRSWSPATIVFALASVFFAACFAVVLLWSLTRPAEQPAASRWVERLPPGHRLDVALFQRQFAISPDGKWLAYVSQHAEGSQLYLRNVSEYEAVALPNTAGAGNPFFSPDGGWLGFFADGKLQRVSTEGGSPLVICDMSAISVGAHWGSNDTILYAQLPGGIFRVPASGGMPEQLTAPDAATGEVHSWPQALPGGRTVLFTVGTTAALLSLDTKRWEVIEALGEAISTRYLPSGHLLFLQGDMLRAVRFDPDELETNGSPITVRDFPSIAVAGWTAFYDVSNTRVFVSLQTSAVEKRLVWVDRNGGVTPLPIGAGHFVRPQLSPDGSRVAVTQPAQHGFGWNIWVYDVHDGRGHTLPIGTSGYEPLWSLDGERIAFHLGAGPNVIGEMRVDGVGGFDTLWTDDTPRWHHSWSPGGILAIYGITEEQGRDIWLVRMPGGHAIESLISTPANERSPAFSPDGRWLAYVSDESGRDEIYVQPYPGMGRKYVISTHGGRDPVWSDDGRELFFRSGEYLMVSDIETSPSFSAATPRVLFTGRFDTEPGISGSHSYDVTPDGRRFLMVQSEPITELGVVLNWAVDSAWDRQP